MPKLKSSHLYRVGIRPSKVLRFLPAALILAGLVNPFAEAARVGGDSQPGSPMIACADPEDNEAPDPFESKATDIVQQNLQNDYWQGF
jgi:hypothetical protein